MVCSMMVRLMWCARPGGDQGRPCDAVGLAFAHTREVCAFCRINLARTLTGVSYISHTRSNKPTTLREWPMAVSDVAAAPCPGIAPAVTDTQQLHEGMVCTVRLSAGAATEDGAAAASHPRAQSLAVFMLWLLAGAVSQLLWGAYPACMRYLVRGA